MNPLGPPLTAAEAAIYESLVVPRYVRPFAVPLIPMLIPYAPASVAHLGCRTGYPADEIARQLPQSDITGVDPSPAAVELARTKASLMSGLRAHYVVADTLPTPLDAGQFTHALAIHPNGVKGNYLPILTELGRVLTVGGQLLLALPLRGSFPEVYDMLREYALRHDRPHFGEAVDAAASTRPNPETLADQVERAGFTEVEIVVDLAGIRFENGRDFLDDPIRRLVVGPDIRMSLPSDDVDEAIAYAAEAIGYYWSEIPFELTVNIGLVSARKF